jgi:hypothetical protein
VTLFLGLCRHQCRVLAVVGLTGWALVVLFAWIGEMAAGGFSADLLSPYAAAMLAAALLPEVLQVCLPLSLAHCLLSLEEGGELRAMRGIGVRPIVIGVALCAPLAPLVFALHPLVHDARPAALARLKQPAIVPARSMWHGIVGQGAGLGVGLVQDERGVRMLLPLGKSALAVRTAGVTERAGVFALGAGDARVVTADGVVHASRFDAVDLTLTLPRRGLAEHDENDFSTHFLQTGSMRWRRSRLDWGGRRSGEVIRREITCRELVLPSVALGLLVCLGLLFVRRELTVVWVHGAVTPLAVTLSVFLPRWLS